MCASYDEDLGDNPLFQTFKTEYSDLFFQAISEGCTICIPRAGSLPSYSITLDDILAHVIYPSEEMPESHFHTLSGKDVKVCNRFVTIESEGECIVSTKVLFEETYYSDDFMKYKVLCIENPLELKDGVLSDGLVELKSLRDCIEYILANSNGMNLVDDLNKEIEDFIQQDELLINSSIQTLKDLTVILCDKCLQITLRSKILRELCYQNSHNVKNLKLAVETYVHHGMFKELFKYISILTSQENSVLNKIIRNSLNVNLRDMDIKAEYHNLIPKAKLELGKISGYSTLLGKFNCLRKMISVISRDPESGGLLAADDLLPIIIFVIIKTDIINWSAQYAYLKHFRYSNDLGDENEFYVTTLEAAIEHIKTGIFMESSSEGETAFISGEYFRKESTTGITHLFQQIAKGEIDKVKQILVSEENHLNFGNLKLCHPLCVCKSCKLIILKSSKNVHPTVNSSNDAGLSALLVASINGQPLILDYLISLNADLHHADENGLTALHYAALKGHQHVLLLLSQAGADVNCLDNSQNTPLHLCCINGHETCVKALIYHSENESVRLLINAQNQNGDTPLFHASKYGYISIVQLLIENNANPSVINKRKLTAFKVANNNKITDILKEAKPRYQGGANSKIINFDFSEDKTLISNSPEDVKKADKMLRAIFYGDINLACFYLGLNPILKIKVCHPLCTCLKCNKSDNLTQPNHTLNINLSNSGGFAALHYAVLYGHFDLVKLLIKNGANVDLQTRNLLSPLIISCQQKRVQIAKYLLDAGCKVDLQDNRGNTALHHACILTYGRLVEIILNYKPKLSVRNKAGRTPVQEAEDKLSLGIVNMLRECGSQ